jgi:hypothetical protein
LKISNSSEASLNVSILLRKAMPPLAANALGVLE